MTLRLVLLASVERMISTKGYELNPATFIYRDTIEAGV